MLGPQRVFNLFHVVYGNYEMNSPNKTKYMIGALSSDLHQSIVLLRLSPRIDDMCYMSSRVFILYENYSLEHICKFSTNSKF